MGHRTVDFQLDMSLIFQQFLTSSVPKLSIISPIFIHFALLQENSPKLEFPGKVPSHIFSDLN